MKAEIHPEYKECVVTCACGSQIHTRSTRDSFHVEICSACHPFFTGKQKLVDTEGRVERFRRRYSDANKAAGSSKAAAPDAASDPKAATH